MNSDRAWRLFAKVSNDLLIACAAVVLAAGISEGLWSDEFLRPTLRVISKSGYEWLQLLVISAAIFCIWIFIMKSRPLDPARIRTHLVIILTEYLFVLWVIFLWHCFHDRQGYLIWALYGLYLLGNILVLMASSVQMALLTWVALGRIPQLPSAWLRVVVSIMAFFGGQALAFLFERALG